MNSFEKYLLITAIFNFSFASSLGAIISSTYSCFALVNSTCIPHETTLNSVAGQSHYLQILPKGSDAGACSSPCAFSLVVTAVIGNVNASVRYNAGTGLIDLIWENPNTYNLAGKTLLRAYIGGQEISNSPLPVLISPGAESLNSLVISGAGSVGGQVNTSLSL